MSDDTLYVVVMADGGVDVSSRPMGWEDCLATIRRQALAAQKEGHEVGEHTAPRWWINEHGGQIVASFSFGDALIAGL